MEMLESEEYGDWLLNELDQLASSRKQCQDAVQRASLNVRIAALEAAKSVFLEFLVLKKSMLEASMYHCT